MHAKHNQHSFELRASRRQVCTRSNKIMCKNERSDNSSSQRLAVYLKCNMMKICAVTVFMHRKHVHTAHTLTHTLYLAKTKLQYKWTNFSTMASKSGCSQPFKLCKLKPWLLSFSFSFSLQKPAKDHLHNRWQWRQQLTHFKWFCSHYNCILFLPDF